VANTASEDPWYYDHRPMRDSGPACKNGSVSDQWLEHGHEMDGSDLAPVFSSSNVLADGAATPPTPRRTTGWRAVVVGGGLALLATLGVVGVANAISDNLFPSMGSTSPASVWQNPVPPAEPAPTTVPSTATTAPATVPTTAPSAVATTIPATTPTSGPSTTKSTTPSSKAVVSPGSSVATSVSPTTSTPDQNDDDLVDDDPVDDDPEDDDLLDDDSSGSSGSSGSGSGSDDSDSSGSSGSDDSVDD
jgi:cytoskeletal protein RodZ